MAFGTLFTGSYSARDGSAVEIFVEREGYSSTTYDLQVVSDTLDFANSRGGIFTPRRQVRSTVSLQAEGSPLEQAKKIPGSTSRQHRVRIDVASSEVFRGFVATEDTSLRINEKMKSVFTVRSRTRIQSLSGDWRKDDGTRFTGDFKLSVILAGILEKLELARPIEAVIDWRPEGMSDTSDPLAIEAAAEAFERTNDRGDTAVESRADVLKDIVGNFGAQLVMEDGVWRLVQPLAFRSGDTVTVQLYDATGSHTGTETQSATKDITGQAWRKDSDEVTAIPQHNEVRITYEHGTADGAEINGSFEGQQGDTAGDDTAGLWTTSGGTSNDFELTDPGFDGSLSQRITGTQAPSTDSLDDMAADASRHVFVDSGGLTQGGEGVTLTFHAKDLLLESGGGDGIPDVPDEVRVYWSLNLSDFNSSDVYWWVSGTGWVEESNTTASDRRNDLTGEDLLGIDGWTNEEKSVTAPPVSGQTELQLYEPIGRRQSSSKDNFQVRILWDDIRFERADPGSAETLFRAFDSGLVEGDSLKRTFRIGDGPLGSSPGALNTPGGDPTGSWRVIGETKRFALHELLAKELMSQLRSSTQLVRANVRAPDLTLPATKAIEWIGARLWPLSVQRNPPALEDGATLAVLQDKGRPSDFQVITGGEDSTEASSTSSSTSSASSWDDVSGKPTNLFARDADSDGFGETVVLKKEDLQDLVENQVAASFEGKVPADTTMIDHVVHDPFDVVEVILSADVAPASDYDVTIDVAGTTHTVTLGAGSTITTATISDSLARKDVLAATTQGTEDSDLEDLTVSVDLEATT